MNLFAKIIAVSIVMSAPSAGNCGSLFDKVRKQMGSASRPAVSPVARRVDPQVSATQPPINRPSTAAAPPDPVPTPMHPKPKTTATTGNGPS